MFNLDSLEKINLNQNLKKDEVLETLEYLGKKLEDKTNNILLTQIKKFKSSDEMKKNNEGYNMELDFIIIVPNLQNLKYNFFTLSYNIFKMYPLEIECSVLSEKILCKDKNELEEKLNILFSYPEVQEIISKLYNS